MKYKVSEAWSEPRTVDLTEFARSVESKCDDREDRDREYLRAVMDEAMKFPKFAESPNRRVFMRWISI